MQLKAQKLQEEQLEIEKKRQSILVKKKDHASKLEERAERMKLKVLEQAKEVR